MSTEITAAQKTALLKLPGFKEIRAQYAKEQKMAGSGRMRGRGFWDDVYNWFVGAGTSVNDFLKKTKLISNVAGAVLPLLAPMGTALLTANPLAAAASVGAAKAAAEGIKSLGYGSNVVMSKMNGKGIFPLAINPAGQRMRGVNPKSKMPGAGDPVDALASGISSLARSIGSLGKNSQVLKNLKKQKGGYSSQDAEYVARAITGRGGYGTTNNTVGVNGVPQKVSTPAHSGMIHNIGGKGKGKPAKMKGMGGSEYGSISSEYGNVQF